MKKGRVLAAALCAAVLMCGFAVPAYAYADGGETTGGYDPAEPEPSPEPNPLTPDGQGTVLDNAADDEGKEFFTITTADEAVFYLVIDRQKSTENVYFLNAVTVADLMALAENTEGAATVAPTPEPEKKAGAGPLLLVLAVMAVGGGAGWYFKIYRPKHQQAAAPEEDYDEAAYDGPEDYEDDPPWDEDGEELEE